jgi:integrase
MIRRKGDRFEVVVDGANGKKRYVGRFDSKRVALAEEMKAKVHERRIRDGEIPAEVDTRRELGASLDAWLDAIKNQRAHKSYSGFVEYQIKPALSTALVASLQPKHIKAWQTGLIGKTTLGMINTALAVLSTACSWFVEQGWIVRNPCQGVARIKVPEQAYNWIKTHAELERLLLNCNDDLRDMVGVAVGTMLRIDEMLHLQWDDVDFSARLITVQRGRKGTTKSGKARWIPILDSVLPILKERALRRGGSVLVFPGDPNHRGRKKASSVRSAAAVGASFHSALERAGLDTSLRWHDLRHTGASWWVQAGGDIFRLSKLLGHHSVSITQKVYAHLIPDVWVQDYARVSFSMPAAPAKVIPFATVA